MSTDPQPLAGVHRNSGDNPVDRRLALFELDYEEGRRVIIRKLAQLREAAEEIPILEAELDELDYLTGRIERPAALEEKAPHLQIAWGVLFANATDPETELESFSTRDGALAHASSFDGSFDLATRAAGGQWHVAASGRAVTDVLDERAGQLISLRAA